MPTNRFVESAFWNFDAMFVPQQHPARELQDTFYVKGECGVARLAIRASGSLGIWASGHLGVWVDRPGVEGLEADADTT
jgi:phenylalanyl-tRNA synthetase alpha chain